MYVVLEQELNNKRAKTAIVNMFERGVAIFGQDRVNGSLALLERTRKRFKEYREGKRNPRMKNRHGKDISSIKLGLCGFDCTLETGGIFALWEGH